MAVLLHGYGRSAIKPPLPWSERLLLPFQFVASELQTHKLATLNAHNTTLDRESRTTERDASAGWRAEYVYQHVTARLRGDRK